jgi:hypothetical protein
VAGAPPPAQSGSPYNKWIALVVVAFGLLVAAGVLIHGDDADGDASSGSTDATAADPSIVTVEYEIIGSANGVEITYMHPTGKRQEPLAMALPYRVSYEFLGPDPGRVFVTGRNVGESGSMTCRIRVDGTVIVKQAVGSDDRRVFCATR